jgi:hypothetical protein
MRGFSMTVLRSRRLDTSIDRRHCTYKGRSRSVESLQDQPVKDRSAHRRPQAFVRPDTRLAGPWQEVSLVTFSIDPSPGGPDTGRFRPADHALAVRQGDALAILVLERGVVYALTRSGRNRGAGSWTARGHHIERSRNQGMVPAAGSAATLGLELPVIPSIADSSSP